MSAFPDSSHGPQIGKPDLQTTAAPTACCFPVQTAGGRVILRNDNEIPYWQKLAPRPMNPAFETWRFLTSTLLFMLVFATVGCSNIHPRSLSGAPNGTVIVERPENNGSVNILPSTVAFSTGQNITLSGGETATVSLPAG